MVIMGQPVLFLYIYLIFLYHVNQCRVQLGTNKVVVELLLLLQAFDCLDIAWLLSNVSDMHIRTRCLLPFALAKWRTLYITFVCYKD